LFSYTFKKINVCRDTGWQIQSSWITGKAKIKKYVGIHTTLRLLKLFINSKSTDPTSIVFKRSFVKYASSENSNFFGSSIQTKSCLSTL